MSVSYEELSRAGTKNQNNLLREYNRIESIIREQLGSGYSNIVIKSKNYNRYGFDVVFKAYMGNRYLSDMPSNAHIIVEFDLHVMLYTPRESLDVSYIDDGVALKEYILAVNHVLFNNACSEDVRAFASIYNSVVRGNYGYTQIFVGGTTETDIVRKLRTSDIGDRYTTEYYFLGDGANGLNDFFNTLFSCPSENYYGRYNISQLNKNILAEIQAGKLTWFIKNQ